MKKTKSANYGSSSHGARRRALAAFRKSLDEQHPADPKIEVSAVENKV
jgi:hypothetical protein